METREQESQPWNCRYIREFYSWMPELHSKLAPWIWVSCGAVHLALIVRHVRSMNCLKQESLSDQPTAGKKSPSPLQPWGIFRRNISGGLIKGIISKRNDLIICLLRRHLNKFVYGSLHSVVSVKTELSVRGITRWTESYEENENQSRWNKRKLCSLKSAEQIIILPGSALVLSEVRIRFDELYSLLVARIYTLKEKWEKYK